MSTANLLEALQKGNVSINFKHWVTEKPLHVVGTLVSKTTIKQQHDSHTIIVYDTDTESWMDIRVSTIIDWKVE